MTKLNEIKMKNEYVARKVAAKDMQPCLVCCKPTTTVLYNGVDWFYVCDIHLENNPQFVTPLHSKEYHDAVNKLKELKSTTDVDRVQDTWITKLLKKNKDDDKEKVGKSEDERRELQRLYEEQLDVVHTLQQKNRKYQLDHIMFDSRIRRKCAEAKWLEQKRIEDKNCTNTDPRELEMNFSFPSVPKS